MAAVPIPRAPIEREKSGTVDSEQGYTGRLLDLRENLFHEALAELKANREFNNIQRYIDALEGNVYDRNRPRYRRRRVDNMMAKARLDSLAALSDIRPTIDVSSMVEAYVKQSEICAKILHDQWDRWDMDVSLLSVIDHALFGVGYWKLGAEISNFAEGKFARLTAAPCGMDTVLPIHAGMSVQESSAICYRTFKPAQWFKNKWGRKADGIERERASTMLGIGQGANAYTRPTRIPEYTWNNMSPAMRRLLGLKPGREADSGEQSTFPVIELQEWWIEDWSINEYGTEVTVKDPYLDISQHNFWYKVKPGERLFPHKRLIIFAGDRIMYDGPSPYWHGLFPFARLCLNPIVWGPTGLSKYRTLLPIDQALNEIDAGVLMNVERATNQVVITRKGAVADADWTAFLPNRPGSKLMVNPGAEPNTAVRYIDPPQLPAYVELFQRYLLNQFERHSGMMDPGKLTGKKQIPAGDSIEQMRDLQAPHFRMEGRFIERFLKDSGMIAVSNIFQYFNRPQRLRMLGADGQTWEDFDYKPDSMIPASQRERLFFKMFSIHIAQGSLHGAAQDRKKQMAVALQQMGSISKREMLKSLEWAHDRRISEIFKEIKEEHDAGLVSAGRVPRMSTSQKSGR
jgi:hypothetical protein